MFFSVEAGFLHDAPRVGDPDFRVAGGSVSKRPGGLGGRGDRPVCRQVFSCIFRLQSCLGGRCDSGQQVLQLTLGISLHFDIKYAAWPYPLLCLIDPTYTDEERTLMCEALSIANECDLPIFAWHFRKRFSEPTIHSMMSPLAKTLIYLGDKGKKFTL